MSSPLRVGVGRASFGSVCVLLPNFSCAAAEQDNDNDLRATIKQVK